MSLKCENQCELNGICSFESDGICPYERESRDSLFMSEEYERKANEKMLAARRKWAAEEYEYISKNRTAYDGDKKHLVYIFWDMLDAERNQPDMDVLLGEIYRDNLIEIYKILKKMEVF